MNFAIEKAQALIEALRYIQRFRDKIVVVKVGGSIQDDPDRMRAAFDDDPRLATLAFCLRLAVIFYRSRRSLKSTNIGGLVSGRG